MKALVRRTLERAHTPPPASFLLSVAFINQARSRALNRRYRGKDSAADVLSFLLEEGDTPASNLEGEILLCPPVIRERARRFETTLQQETERLLVHGLLHLLGIHHHRRAEEQRMVKIEEGILGRRLAN